MPQVKAVREPRDRLAFFALARIATTSPAGAAKELMGMALDGLGEVVASL